MSLPLRERGLKSLYVFCPFDLITVAPLAGAWIEIIPIDSLAEAIKSLPLRERGLKYKKHGSISHGYPSLPLRERGLK